ncbi:hypothetical protein ACFMQL_20490 [Nonomuraea fastidiosa]|uniref:hypothetical protein n=1 Tax=Nonomuraea fastidiosa TaxID=46173 RepID=UPI003670BEC9
MAIILEDFEDETLAFTITGTWTRVQETAASGSWSLRSAVISDNGTTDATVTIPDQATLVSFRYKVSSEEGYDKLTVLIDGTAVLEASGEVDWTEASADVTGKSQVVFRYAKDGSFPEGQDAAWIDDLAFDIPGVEVDGSDGGTLAENVVSVVQAPEVALSGSDSATLAEARWVAEPQSTLVPPSVRSTSTGFNGTSTYTVNAPSGIASGDTIIAIQAADRGTTAEMTTPTGGSEWLPLDTLGDTVSGVARVVSVWWKRAGSAEPSTYTFKQFSASDGVCLIIAIRDASLTVDPVLARSTAGGGAVVTTPGITPTSVSDLELRLAAVRPTSVAMTLAPPPGLSPLTSIQSRQYTAVAAAVRLLVSPEDTSPADWTASVSQITWRAGYTVAIAPTVVGPPQEELAAADTVTVGEAASVFVVPAGEPVAADDAAALGETAAAAGDLATSDAATLVEVLTVEAGLAGADQAALAEAADLRLVLEGREQAVLADVGQLHAQAAAADAGALAELVSIAETIGPVAADTGTLTEASAVAAAPVAADVAALAETAFTMLAKHASDAGQVSDMALVGMTGADAAALSEQIAVDAVASAVDGVLLAEAARLEAPKTGADAVVLSEQAVVVETREIGGAGLVRRAWSVRSPLRRWAAGKPRRAWRAHSPRT